MKKLVVLLGTLIGIVIAVAIIVPLVVDVDQYRPKVTETVNQKINGKFELGKLKLSLWGQIRVQVDGVKLTDPQGRTMLSVASAYFHIPFSSLLSGQPLLTFHMQEPKIAAVKNAQGKINLAQLLKSEPASASAGQAAGSTSANQAQSPAASTAGVPKIVSNSRLGIAIVEAALEYSDEGTKSKTQIDHLNIRVRDLSLSRPTEIEITANLKSSQATEPGKTLQVSGPLKLTLKSQAQSAGSGEIQRLQATFDLNADDLQIELPSTFQKGKGIPANLTGSLIITDRDAQIERAVLKFHNAELLASGTVQRAEPMQTAIKLESNAIDLKPWNQLIPAAKEADLSGTARAAFEAHGPAKQLEYSGNLAIENLKVKAPSLKTQPVFQARMEIKTDQIEKFVFSMAAPGNDLNVQGSVKGFSAPRVELSASSKSLDLDQLLVLPPLNSGSKSAGSPAAGGSGSAGGKDASPAQAAAEDFDRMLDPMRSNPMMTSLVMNLGVDLGMIQIYGVKMTGTAGRATLRDLVLDVSQLSTRVFSGTVKSTARLAMRPKAPTYSWNLDVIDLNIKDAVTSQFEFFKNTLFGRATLKMNGQGASLNPEAAKRNLDAKGNLKVVDATFASVDIGKMAAEAINGSLEKVKSKVPALKDKGLKSLPPRESKYQSITSDFTISKGVFSAPNFATVSVPNQGIDLKGATTFGLIDKKVSAQWEVIDTHNMLKARDLSVEQMGVKVDHILAEGNGPVKFPVTVSGTADQPVFSYTEIPEYFSKIALANVAGAAKGKAKAEVKQKVLDQVQKVAPNAPAPVQNAIKKLFGG
jgi:hypothetical protein